MFKFVFRRRFTFFDIAVFTPIGVLAASRGLIWLLLLLPACFLSAFGELIFGDEK